MNNDKCAVCYDAILNNQGLCTEVPPDKLIPNCSEYSLNKAATVDAEEYNCDKCQYGYLKTENKCVRCAESACAICVEANKCVACFGNLLSENGKCVQKQSELEFCEVPATPNTCELCTRGYAVTPKLDCVGIYGEGKKYDPQTGKFQECFDGTFFSENGICIGTPKMLPNDRPFGLSSTNWKVIMLWIVFLVMIAGIIFYINRLYESSKFETEGEPVKETLINS